MNLFYEWITGTLSRSVCTFNLNRAVQSIKLHHCCYSPFTGLITTQRLRNKRRLSNEYTLSWLTSCMFRRKRTRADPSLVDSLALSFGCSFVDSFIRSVSQYMIHVFIHSCCMHRRKRARADPSLVDSLTRLFVRPVIHPFINSVSQSVRVYHSRISLFVCSFIRSFIHSFLPSVSQSPETKRPPRDKGLLTKLVQSRWLYIGLVFFRRVGGETVIVANIQLSWPQTWTITHFSSLPALQKFNCVAALPELKSYLL